MVSSKTRGICGYCSPQFSDEKVSITNEVAKCSCHTLHKPKDSHLNRPWGSKLQKFHNMSI